LSQIYDKWKRIEEKGKENRDDISIVKTSIRYSSTKSNFNGKNSNTYDHFTS